jgi:uncharacterized protein (TIGR03083 family)
MSSRRDVLVDAAIQVLGERGVRAVTHPAVDGEAGVAAGSTANYVPTRDALLDAIVERGHPARARQLCGSRGPDVPAVARAAVWHAIDKQRMGLIELLEGLSEPDWSHPSLCDGWTVKDVAPHVALQNTSWWSLPRASLNPMQAGGLNGAIDHAARRHAQRSSTGDIITEIRDRVGVWRPLPTVTYRDTAVDDQVHSQDIGIPLGRPVHLRTDLAVIAAHAWSSPRMFHARRACRNTRPDKPICAARLVSRDSWW